MKAIELLLGRILLAHIFILAGINKLGAGYSGTQAYMESMGVPGALLPVVITLEIAGGLALAVGTGCVYRGCGHIVSRQFFRSDTDYPVHEKHGDGGRSAGTRGCGSRRTQPGSQTEFEGGLRCISSRHRK
jgi:hypothetical protein